MKIAIPTRDGMVDNHFGHCDHYTIWTVEQKQIIASEIYPSPVGCGCKSDVAERLAEMGVSVMLAGNMGDGANNKLQSAGIKVIRGCSGKVEEVLRSYLSGYIMDSGISCSAHEGHHECSH